MPDDKEAQDYNEEHIEFPPISLEDMGIIESIANIDSIENVWINENLEVVERSAAESLIRNIGLGPMNESVGKVFSNWMKLMGRVENRSLTMSQLQKLVGADQKFHTLMEYIEPFLTEEQKDSFRDILGQIDAIVDVLSARAEQDEDYQGYLAELAKQQALIGQIRNHPGYHGDVRINLIGYPPGVYHIFASRDDEKTFYLRYLILRDNVYQEQTIYIRITPIGISARGVTEANRPLGEGGYWDFEELMDQLKEQGDLTFAAGSKEAVAARDKVQNLRRDLESLPSFVRWGQTPPLFPEEGYRIVEGDPGALIERLEMQYTVLDKYGRLSMQATPMAITPDGYWVWEHQAIATIDELVKTLQEEVAKRCGSEEGKVKAGEAVVKHMATLFQQRWNTALKQPAAALLKQTPIALTTLMRQGGRILEPGQRWMDFDNMVEKIFSAFTAPSARLHPFSMTPNLAGKDRDNTIVPYNYNRVGAYGASDYINASHVSLGGSQYIVAQAPLKATLKEFWEMVQRENIEHIVNLSPLEERGEGACVDYYSTDVCPMNITPDIFVQHEGEEELMAVNVTRDDQLIKERVVVRNLHLLEGTHTLARVTQYHYDNWPKDDTPEADLLMKLLEVLPEGKKLLVHSSRGAGRAGTFVAIHSLVTGEIAPKLKAGKSLDEIEVNPEETVLKLLMQRTEPVANIAQLGFIYRAIAEYASRV